MTALFVDTAGWMACADASDPAHEACRGTRDTALRSGQVLVTTDSNLKYQQNLKARRVAVVVLSTPSWPRIERAVVAVVGAIDAAAKGSYVEVEIP